MATAASEMKKMLPAHVISVMRYEWWW